MSSYEPVTEAPTPPEDLHITNNRTPSDQHGLSVIQWFALFILGAGLALLIYLAHHDKQLQMRDEGFQTSIRQELPFDKTAQFNCMLFDTNTRKRLALWATYHGILDSFTVEYQRIKLARIVEDVPSNVICCTCENRMTYCNHYNVRKYMKK